MRVGSLSTINIATSFSSIEGVRAVLASDVRTMIYANPINDTIRFTALGEKRRLFRRRGNFVIYSNGEFSSNLTKNEYRLRDMLKEIRKYITIGSGGGRRQLSVCEE